jgi:adenine phosphoribosyltransferase
VATQSMCNTTEQTLRQAIGNIPDFPKPGILFRDIMPILQDPQLFTLSIDWFSERVESLHAEYVVGIESRGFIFGAAIAQRLGIGFVPARKKGKLPGIVESVEYDLEYGTDCVQMQQNAFPIGSRIVIVDDLLATGGTAVATTQLIQKVGGLVEGSIFLIELDFLKGRDALEAQSTVQSLIHY